ncbi:lycopene beta-cyclase CrtY [Alteraurantiacibacter aquimixticola]|uniref:Lycopene beta-cyclase CrtY n=1 Tax=Alteraurantiacibacter aquimixticola TaxID=2489173 RepID=A0A4T3EYI8_9SPHN|nr:lycopene beta-cyclase CrtY [Alteraurantiacibacter aquimixticola]TIX49729.1 lycopene beta-cyclase CrtY [Alteraurantiacibacter aquimixticola]
MNARTCDIAIIGGGLSGGLIALALARHRPELTLRLVEAGEALGGNHRWSWFSSDLSEDGKTLLSTVRTAHWGKGNRVAFPAYQRQLTASYNSMSSSNLSAALHRELPEEAILLRRKASTVDAAGVTLEDGTRITARTVIDARGMAGSEYLHGGWQVFMGRHLRTAEPHGIEHPVIMDATVDQLAPAGDGGAYRFVYILPLGAHDLFVEDTYYADDPALDRSLLSGRIDQYCSRVGISGEPLGFETGVLPVVTGGNFAAFQEEQRIPGVAMVGARGGFVHPLTSYTLPFAVEIALAVAEDADLPGEQLSAKLEARARAHWRRMGFYRKLGNMLFGAAEPSQRFRIFERFYRLPEGLIERFYAGRSTFADKARILIGKPPVPISRALSALSSARPALQVPPSESDSK